MSLSLEEALAVIGRHRGEQVVIPTMASVGSWPAVSDTPLDFAYMPSSMGQGIAIGLGVALAQPDRGVIVLSGDGSLLMNLGSLVTVASHPAKLRIVLMDNGLYEVTGGQPTPGAHRINYALLAQGAGLGRVYSADTPASWEAHAAAALSGPGPTFSWLKIAGRLGMKTPKPPRPMAEQIRRLREAITAPISG